MTRIRVTLATLLGIAITAAGTLTKALAWPASPLTGLTVAASALLTVACIALATRIVTAAERAGQNPPPGAPTRARRA